MKNVHEPFEYGGSIVPITVQNGSMRRRDVIVVISQVGFERGCGPTLVGVAECIDSIKFPLHNRFGQMSYIRSSWKSVIRFCDLDHPGAG